MVKIVKPEIPFKTFGDVEIYGKHSEYLGAFDWDDIEKKEMNPMPLAGMYGFGLNPWKALVHAGIDAEDVKKLKNWSTCYCPGTEREYNAIVPVSILTNDAKVYTSKVKLPFSDMFEDGNWNRSMTWNRERNERPVEFLSGVERAILGSGYMEFILPCDGSNGYEFFTVSLENGDKIIFVGWVWYNK